MPCIPFRGPGGRINWLCVGNEPVALEHNGRTYRFEFTAASGWCPVNRDGSIRLSPVPQAVWDRLLEAYKASLQAKEE